MSSYVYFLRPVGADGPIKIGSSRAPWDRLQLYASWSPVQLELVATILGGLDLERRFHARFAHLHSHHEWFSAAPELSSAIAEINAGTFSLASLPGPKSVLPKRVVSPESIESGVNVRRLSKLVEAGVDVPRKVYLATLTYRCSPEETSRRRAVVKSWLALYAASGSGQLITAHNEQAP